MEDRRDPTDDVPEADAAEQKQSWAPDEEDDLPEHIDPDVPEADALEQARPVPLEDEDR